ncbi:MAG: hypothetical protein ABEJ07_04880 [Candidatus Nanohaloarchaea archaeon]
MTEVEYKSELDILVVEEEDYEDLERNVELDGFVLDLDSDGGFLGLEIVDVSQKVPLSREELERIEDAEVRFESGEDYIAVQIVLTIDSSKNVISSRYPAGAIA